MRMDDVVTPYKGPTGVSRNSTERSRLCERIINYFIRQGASAASVNWDKTQFDQGSLYKGLRNTLSKDAYKGRVKVQLKDGIIILKRINQ